MLKITFLTAACLLAAPAAAQAPTHSELFAALTVCKDAVKWTTAGGRRITFEGDGAADCNAIAAKYYDSIPAERASRKARSDEETARRKAHIKGVAEKIK